jgi:hypothetical protein
MQKHRETKTPTKSAAFDPDSHRAVAAKQLGIKDGVEGNYVSTGSDLVLLDSAEGVAMLSAMHEEGVGKPSRSAFLADCGDVNVERTFADDRARPHPFHHMVLGDELGGRLYEDRDDLEGPAAERYGNPARPELAPAEVDLPLIARIDQIGACFRHLALADWISRSFALCRNARNTLAA